MAGRLALFLGLACLALAPACKKKPLEPSAHYEKASRIHQDLYVRQLDDAYLDPRMDEVVAELKQVPQESADYDPAQELLATIQKGKETAKKERAEQEKQRAELQKGLASLSAVDPAAVLARDPAPPPPPPEPVDAGPAAADPFAPGAAIADINAANGGCLVAGVPFAEEGTKQKGVTYKLADSQGCRDKLPGLVNDVLLVVDGRIYRRVSKSDVTTKETQRPAVDAGTPAPAQPAQANAAPKPPAPVSAGGNPLPSLTRTENPPAIEGTSVPPPPENTSTGDVDPQVKT
ncbi:MAG: hypothetical protein JST92_27450, partial [Deltaproteobacteria bacterium]|nr:hypothetical protein [Deltaproteobacteria bacterium]